MFIAMSLNHSTDTGTNPCRYVFVTSMATGMATARTIDSQTRGRAICMDSGNNGHSSRTME